jgi:hypothetical protein
LGGDSGWFFGGFLLYWGWLLGIWGCLIISSVDRIIDLADIPELGKEVVLRR